MKHTHEEPGKDIPSARSILYSMGTVITSQVYGRDALSAVARAETAIRSMNARWSRFDKSSEISMINRMAGIEAVPISVDTLFLLRKAKEFALISERLFDITIAPLVALWGTWKEARITPVWADVQERRQYVDCAGIMLDEQRRTARLSRKGQMIDLGGIAKGCASDRICHILRDCGIRSGYTDLGGNVAVIGTKPDGSPWKIGIRHPRKDNALIGFISVKDRSVVTSGDDQRYYDDLNGDRHHHLLDPRTGYPADSGLISVTVIADSGETADALSTILFIAGEDKGREILRHFPDVDAIYVRKDESITLTPGACSCFTAADGIPVSVSNTKKGAFNTNEE